MAHRQRKNIFEIQIALENLGEMVTVFKMYLNFMHYFSHRLHSIKEALSSTIVTKNAVKILLRDT